jgi:hypothetical protein
VTNTAAALPCPNIMQNTMGSVYNIPGKFLPHQGMGRWLGQESQRYFLLDYEELNCLCYVGSSVDYILFPWWGNEGIPCLAMKKL